MSVVYVCFLMYVFVYVMSVCVRTRVLISGYARLCAYVTYVSVCYVCVLCMYV